MTIVLSEEDRVELVDLYQKAQTTPAILLFGKYDLSKEAWDAVRDKMDELGGKYGFDPRTCPINQETGEVQSLESKAKRDEE